jgi:sulfur relay (sulfurtransferase) DsrF/TusC family protein
MSANPMRPSDRPLPAAPGGSIHPAGSRWRDAAPELGIAAILVAAAALAAAAVSGWPGVVVVAAAAAVLALLVLRGTIPRSSAQAFRRAKAKPKSRSIFGYGQRRYVVAASLSSRGLYESDLRPALEHILAARLADSHGVNLYTDPEAARRTFCRTRADEALWSWVDPAQALNPDDRDRAWPDIPRHKLGRLITRLEQL